MAECTCWPEGDGHDGDCGIWSEEFVANRTPIRTERWIARRKEQPDPVAAAYKQGWITARNEWKPRAEKAEAELANIRQVIEPLRTPETWCRLHDVTVLDPDGWRWDLKSWREPLTEAEFEERLAECTLRDGYEPG